MKLRQQEYMESGAFLRESLTMHRKLLGEDDKRVTFCLNDLALVHHMRGDHSEAERLYRDVLARIRHLKGNERANIIRTLNNLGAVLCDAGRFDEAAAAFKEAAGGFEDVRRDSGTNWLKRVALAAEVSSPCVSLSTCLARRGESRFAWRALEANLGRGLLDAVAARRTPPWGRAEVGHKIELVAEVKRLERQLEAERRDASPEQLVRLTDQLREAQAEATGFESKLLAEYGPLAGDVFELDRIRAQLPDDAALIAWVDVDGRPTAADPSGEHWACLVRKLGDPVWARLPGTGEGGAWTKDDARLPRRLRQALGRTARQESEDIAALKRQVYEQRIAPLESELANVRRLIVVPTGQMAGVPVEVLTDTYTVSYTPSGTLYAWLREKAGERDRADNGEDAGGLLALGDPVFARPADAGGPAPPPPDHGVLLTMVTRGSAADRAGLREGDVVLSYAGTKLTGPSELAHAIESAPRRDKPGADSAAKAPPGIRLDVWRNGQTVEKHVAPGKLGIVPNQRPAPEAVRQVRRVDALLRGGEGPFFAALPGTRREVEAIAKLYANAKDSKGVTVLLGPEASERQLEELAASEQLRSFRFLHLATHGQMDDRMAMRSALILAQDRLSDPLEQVQAGRAISDARLTAGEIIHNWELDAELVTLSGCETALGKTAGGEGYLGFSQALFIAGARSLVLSLWKVPDQVTPPLMVRFYHNLIDRRMSKAEGLREAKHWLRDLTADQVKALKLDPSHAATMRGGTRRRPSPTSASDRPYADTFYWAAFILIGDGS